MRWQGPLRIEMDGAIRATPASAPGADDCVLVYRTPQSGVIDVTLPLIVAWRPFDLW